jgi:hypothetical protein
MPPITPVPIPPSTTETAFVTVATADYIGATVNFTSGSPNWINKTGAITGVIADFILDPWAPTTTAFVAASTGIWRTQTLNQTLPIWYNVMSVTAFKSYHVGQTLDTFQSIRATIGSSTAGKYYTLALSHSGAGVFVDVGYTADYGETWSWAQVGLTTSASHQHGLAVSQHNAGTVLAACGAGGIHRSTDYGATFTRVYNVPGRATPVANIEIPYENNSNDMLNIVSGSGGGAITRYDSSAGWSLSSWERTGLGTPEGVPPSFNVPYGLDTIDVWLYATAPNNDSLPWSYFEIDLGEVQGAGVTIQFRIQGGTNRFYYVYAGTGGALTMIRGKTVIGTSWQTTAVLSVEGYRYVRLYNRQDTAFPFAYGFVNSYQALPPYILKTGDGFATAPVDITPAEGGAILARGLLSSTVSSQSLYALVGRAANAMTLTSSSDLGNIWYAKQGGLNGAVAIGGWPYNMTGIYWLEDTATGIRYSADTGNTPEDKTGDWSTVFGTFEHPVNIIPDWTK